jgi:hypothetical protein
MESTNINTNMIQMDIPNGYNCEEMRFTLKRNKKIPISCSLKEPEQPKPKSPSPPPPNMPPIADVEINRPWDVFDHREDRSKMPHSIDFKGYRYEICQEITIPEGFAGAGTKQYVRLPAT